MHRRQLFAFVAGVVGAMFHRTSAAVPVLPRQRAVPGGVVVMPLGAAAQAPRARLDEVPVLVHGSPAAWRAVVGIPLETAAGAALLLVVEDADGGTRRHAIDVQAKAYRTQHLSVPRDKVELSEADLARHERERAHLHEVLRAFSPASPATLALRAPVAGRRSSSFGLRRVFNGEARNPHNGMDIAARAGTAVRAAGNGRVVDTGDYFFPGRVVVVDHGMGLMSLYAHLDRIAVQAGATVMRGQPLGSVGATGRVTGAHLHFSVYLNATAVDPALFLEG